MASPFTVRWGILATGGIAETFSKDLLCDPAGREVADVVHEIAAVSSSSSQSRAEEFLKKINAPSSTKAYGSYAELVNDPNVDIIYVATPHSHHFQNVMLAFEAGKNVLCEKSLTVTARQARKLVETAKAKNVFFMEAVWTRFFPLSIKIRETISSGAIGTVYRTFADLAFNENAEHGKLAFEDSNRMVNPNLAGGATLDLGIYPLTWVFQTIYHLQQEKETPQVVAAMQKYHTGADETASIIVSWPKHQAQGIATASLRVATDTDKTKAAGAAIRIQGSEGEIQVLPPAFRPTAYRVLKRDGNGKVEHVECPIPRDPKRDAGHGMFWEADECARCLRDGKKQSSTMPWEESIVLMEVMEQALSQGDIKYPDLITTDVYDAKSPLNTGQR